MSTITEKRAARGGDPSRVQRDEVERKHGNTHIAALRLVYGKDFAPGHDDQSRLGEVLSNLDGPSLAKLVSNKPVRSPVRHEDDLYTWAMAQIALLRSGHTEQLDLSNIAEEFEDVASREYDGLESALMVVLVHMLKWEHQPDFRTRSWVFSILEHRRRVERRLERSPGLKSRRDEAIAEGYRRAVYYASMETGLDIGEFPAECLYSWDEIMTLPFEWKG